MGDSDSGIGVGTGSNFTKVELESESTFFLPYWSSVSVKARTDKILVIGNQLLSDILIIGYWLQASRLDTGCIAQF